MKYRATIAMLTIAVLCAIIHLYSGWQVAIRDSQAHGQTAIFSEYIVEWVRDTFENLQSEFWQLSAQFSILAGLWTFFGVKIHAYEEDLEEIKKRLNSIEVSVGSLVNR